MSRSQRDKGARYEREVAHVLSQATGTDVARNLSQPRDSGADLHAVIGRVRFAIECKRRARLGQLYDWMAQAAAGATDGETPIVVARADRETDHLVILRLQDLLTMLLSYGNEART